MNPLGFLARESQLTSHPPVDMITRRPPDPSSSSRLALLNFKPNKCRGTRMLPNSRSISEMLGLEHEAPHDDSKTDMTLNPDENMDPSTPFSKLGMEMKSGDSPPDASDLSSSLHPPAFNPPSNLPPTVTTPLSDTQIDILKTMVSPLFPKAVSHSASHGPIGHRLMHAVQLFRQCNPHYLYNEELRRKPPLVKNPVATANNGYDNQEGQLVVRVGDIIYSETNCLAAYRVIDRLGEGSFGHVTKCVELQTGKIRALKIMKNRTIYTSHQAWVEVKLLRMMNDEFDRRDKRHIVRLHNFFTYKGHLCLVFEMLSLNLFELLRLNDLRGLSLQLVRVIGRQVFDALELLSFADIIHCDLKPENIGLSSLSQPDIKLIDFGAATSVNSRLKFTYIQSRFYRAFEIVMASPQYTTAIDIWSSGCVLVELYLGKPLFPAHNTLELLQRILLTIGYPPFEYVCTLPLFSKYFVCDNDPSSDAEDAEQPYRLNGDVDDIHAPYDYTDSQRRQRDEFLAIQAEAFKRFEELGIKFKPNQRYHLCPDLVKSQDPPTAFHNGWTLPSIVSMYPYSTGLSLEALQQERSTREKFVHLLMGIFRYLPWRRYTAYLILKHPFFTRQPLHTFDEEALRKEEEALRSYLFSTDKFKSHLGQLTALDHDIQVSPAQMSTLIDEMLQREQKKAARHQPRLHQTTPHPSTDQPQPQPQPQLQQTGTDAMAPGDTQTGHMAEADDQHQSLPAPLPPHIDHHLLEFVRDIHDDTMDIVADNDELYNDPTNKLPLVPNPVNTFPDDMNNTTPQSVAPGDILFTLLPLDQQQQQLQQQIDTTGTVQLASVGKPDDTLHVQQQQQQPPPQQQQQQQETSQQAFPLSHHKPGVPNQQPGELNPAPVYHQQQYTTNQSNIVATTSEHDTAHSQNGQQQQQLQLQQHHHHQSGGNIGRPVGSNLSQSLQQYQESQRVGATQLSLSNRRHSRIPLIPVGSPVPSNASNLSTPTQYMKTLSLNVTQSQTSTVAAHHHPQQQQQQQYTAQSSSYRLPHLPPSILPPERQQMADQIQHNEHRSYDGKLGYDVPGLIPRQTYAELQFNIFPKPSTSAVIMPTQQPPSSPHHQTLHNHNHTGMVNPTPADHASPQFSRRGLSIQLPGSYGSSNPPNPSPHGSLHSHSLSQHRFLTPRHVTTPSSMRPFFQSTVAPAQSYDGRKLSLPLNPGAYDGGQDAETMGEQDKYYKHLHAHPNTLINSYLARVGSTGAASFDHQNQSTIGFGAGAGGDGDGDGLGSRPAGGTAQPFGGNGAHHQDDSISINLEEINEISYEIDSISDIGIPDRRGISFGGKDAQGSSKYSSFLHDDDDDEGDGDAHDNDNDRSGDHRTNPRAIKPRGVGGTVHPHENGAGVGIGSVPIVRNRAASTLDNGNMSSSPLYHHQHGQRPAHLSHHQRQMYEARSYAASNHINRSYLQHLTPSFSHTNHTLLTPNLTTMQLSTPTFNASQLPGDANPLSPLDRPQLRSQTSSQSFGSLLGGTAHGADRPQGAYQPQSIYDLNINSTTNASSTHDRETELRSLIQALCQRETVLKAEITQATQATQGLGSPSAMHGAGGYLHPSTLQQQENHHPLQQYHPAGVSTPHTVGNPEMANIPSIRLLQTQLNDIIAQKQRQEQILAHLQKQRQERLTSANSDYFLNRHPRQRHSGGHPVLSPKSPRPNPSHQSTPNTQHNSLITLPPLYPQSQPQQQQQQQQQQQSGPFAPKLPHLALPEMKPYLSSGSLGIAASSPRSDRSKPPYQLKQSSGRLGPALRPTVKPSRLSSGVGGMSGITSSVTINQSSSSSSSLLQTPHYLLSNPTNDTGYHPGGVHPPHQHLGGQSMMMSGNLLLTTPLSPGAQLAREQHLQSRIEYLRRLSEQAQQQQQQQQQPSQQQPYQHLLSVQQQHMQSPFHSAALSSASSHNNANPNTQTFAMDQLPFRPSLGRRPSTLSFSGSVSSVYSNTAAAASSSTFGPLSMTNAQIPPPLMSSPHQQHQQPSQSTAAATSFMSSSTSMMSGYGHHTTHDHNMSHSSYQYPGTNTIPQTPSTNAFSHSQYSTSSQYTATGTGLGAGAGTGAMPPAHMPYPTSLSNHLSSGTHQHTGFNMNMGDDQPTTGAGQQYQRMTRNQSGTRNTAKRKVMFAGGQQYMIIPPQPSDSTDTQQSVDQPNSQQPQQQMPSPDSEM